MSNSRRNIIIRTVATILGDIAAGVALASVAIWIIQAATLGLFLRFLLWLLAAIASLAFSHPYPNKWLLGRVRTGRDSRKFQAHITCLDR